MAQETFLKDRIKGAVKKYLVSSIEEIVTALNAIAEQLTAINEILKAKNTDSGTNGGEKT